MMIQTTRSLRRPVRRCIWEKAAATVAILSLQGPAWSQQTPSPVVPEVALARVPADGLRISSLADVVGAPQLLTLDISDATKSDTSLLGEMNLLSAMRGALIYSLEGKAAIERAVSARYTERAALGQLLPRVDARYSTGQARFEQSSRGEPEWMERADSTVSVRQPLFNFSALATWNQQKELAAAAEQRRETTEGTIALEAASAFLAVYQAQLTIEYGREYSTMLQDLERIVSARAASGATSPADADRVRSRVANTQAILSEARATLSAALSNLRRLVGGVPRSLSIGLIPQRIAPVKLDAATLEGLSENPELKAGRRDLAAAALERNAIQGRFMPQVDVEASQLNFRNANGLQGQQQDQRLMLVMSMPIYTGGSDLAAYRALAAKRREQEYRLGEAERKLTYDLENAFSVLDSISPRLTSSMIELTANRKVVSAFREQLFAANRSLLDVLDAYQRLYQSKIDLTALLVAEAQTKLRVSQVTGRLQVLLRNGEVNR